MRILPAFNEIETADSERFEKISLRETPKRLDHSLREPLARYLSESQMLMMAGNIEDPLDPAKGPVPPFGFSTDGEWAWPTYWGYFVREYGTPVPDGFLTHAHARNFEPVLLSSEDSQRASEAIQKILYG